MTRSYPGALLEWPGHSDNELRKLLIVKTCYTTKRQQLINYGKPSIQKLCLDAVTIVVCKHRIFHLDPTQKCLHNEAMT